MTADFPQPVRFGEATTRWCRADVLRWIQAVSGRSLEITKADELVFMRDTEVADLISTSRATVWRKTRESAKRAA